MIGELEALVGYVFVVGGRAVSAAPPGALVALPPKKTLRGRDQDTVCMLVTPSGTDQAQAAFYEQLARMAADVYFASTGSVTNGLREATNAVNTYLLNAPAPRYQTNLIAVVLRGREVYAARAGAGLIVLRQGDTLLSAPEDPHDEYALNGLPLGYSPAPDVKLTHYEIMLGQTLIISDAGFAAADRDQLSLALAQSDLNGVLNALKPLAAPRTQALVIQFAIAAAPTGPLPASPDAPPPIPPPSAVMPSPTAPIVSPAPVVTDSALTPSAPVVKSPAQPGGVRRVTRPIRRGIVFVLTGIARVLNAILNWLLPEPEDGKPHIPAALAVGIAILIPVVIVFIMMGLRLTQIDETNFEKLVQQVQSQVSQANAVPASDIEHARTLWLAVLQRADEADQVHPGDPMLTKIRTQAQRILDGYASVTRRPATPLRTFGATAKLGAVWVQGGTDLYTLDLTASAIYRDTLRAPDTIGTRSTQPIVQAGSAANAYSVKRIVSLIWLNEGGIRNSHALVGLDTQGVLITYSPAFAPALAEPLSGIELWSKPIALRSWQDRLYILDVGANQIWRYIPIGTAYPNAPEQYFTAAYQRSLANAVDFAIDAKGNVYVLFSDGTLKQYNAGAEQPLTLSGLPDGKLKAANAMYLDSNSLLPALYVLDPLDGSIYEFTLDGKFQARFRSTDVNAFNKLTSIFADGTNLYVTSGQTLYYFNSGTVTVSATGTP